MQQLEQHPPVVSLEQAIEMALQACRDNQADKALGIFDDILTVAPKLDQVWHLNAQLLLELERYHEGMNKVCRALELAPENDDYRFTQALLHYRAGELVSAEQLLVELKGSRPDQRAILELLHQIYQRQNKLILVRKLAKELEHATEEQSPLMEEVNHNLKLAAQFIDGGQLDQADMLLDGVLLIRPNSIKGLWLRGLLDFKKGDLEASCRSYEQVIDRFTHPKFLIDYVKSLVEYDLREEAIERLKEGLKQFPDEKSLKFLLASVYFKMHDWENAYQAFRQLKAEGVEADKIAKYKLLAEFKYFLEFSTDFETAKACYFIRELEHMRELLPDDTEVSNALGYLLELCCDYEGSLAIMRQVADKTGSNTAYWNLHSIYRASRDYPAFFESYRKGLKSRFGAKGAEAIREKVWQGEPLANKQVLVLTEQGVGDELLHAHNYRWVAEQAKRTVIYCEPRLKSSFERLFDNAMFIATKGDRKRIYPGVEALINNADYVIPAGDLAGWMYERLEYPFSDRHYFKPPLERIEYWRGSLAALPNRKKVGLCWRSGKVNAQRSVHYLSNDEVARILRALPKDVDVINVMYDECEQERAWLEAETGVRIHHFDDIDLKNDFADTAALLSQLDVVITPLISVWELSEAVGTPTATFYGDYFYSDGVICKPSFWYPDTIQFCLAPFKGKERDAAVDALASHINTEYLQ